MSHYEKRLQEDLDKIRGLIQELGKDVEVAVESAVDAVVTADQGLAAQVILGDHPINRATRDLDRRCHAFVARHLPSAGHLRFISSVMRLLVATERVGDYAVTACREAVQMNAVPPEAITKDIRMIGDAVRITFAQSMQAFVKADVPLAREAMARTGETRSASTRVFEDLVRTSEEGGRSTREALALLVVLNRLERVGDQAKNICEETVFTVTGETKNPKVYRVLFVGHRGDHLAKMAEFIARKAFPESGEFSSAGVEASQTIDPEVVSFMESHGHSMDGQAPEALNPNLDHLSGFHVIVDFTGGLREKIEGVPFHTVLVHWDLPSGEGMEALYGQVSGNIRHLMETLRGENAG